MMISFLLFVCISTNSLQKVATDTGKNLKTLTKIFLVSQTNSIILNKNPRKEDKIRKAACKKNKLVKEISTRCKKYNLL